MYQSLYRKYRPSNFNEVIGQEVIKKTLSNAIKYNKISHAYIFEGPRGTGKTSLAKIFAKTINCLDLIDDIPCNRCVSCTQIQNNCSMDVIEIDAASCNSVDNVRNIISNCETLPVYSKYKIYIIDEVHMFSIGAFNALLKTIEEPPQHVIFILATTDSQKIPETIISRCQIFNFKKISKENIVNRLKFICKNEDIIITDEALQIIAELSDGGLRDAISMLDQAISYKINDIKEDDIHTINGTLSKDEIKDFIKNFDLNNIEYILNLINKYDEEGKNLQQIVLEIVNYLKYCLYFLIAPKFLESKNLDYNNYDIKIDKIKLYELTNSFNEIYQSIKNSSDTKLILELEIVKIMNNCIKKNVEENLKLDNKLTKQDKIIKEKSKETKTLTKEINKEIKKKIVDSDKYEPYYIYDNNLFNNYKKTIINNTLATFDKKTFKFIKDNIMMINSLLIDRKFASLCALILDGKIKAASDSSLVFVFDNKKDVEFFNNSIIDIEIIFRETFNKEFKVVGLSNEEWEPYKNDFNSKKQFEYINISMNCNDIFKKISKENKIETDFKELIEEEK